MKNSNILSVYVTINAVSTFGWTWRPRGPFSTASPRSGTDGVPIPVSASAFSSRRRGTPHIRIYTRRASLRTCTQELVRVLQRYVIYVIRRNDNGYLHGGHRERRIATVARCRGDTASSTRGNFPRRFCRSYNPGEKGWVSISRSYHEGGVQLPKVMETNCKMK